MKPTLFMRSVAILLAAGLVVTSIDPVGAVAIQGDCPQSEFHSIPSIQISGRHGGLPLQFLFTLQALAPELEAGFKSVPVDQAATEAGGYLPEHATAAPTPSLSDLNKRVVKALDGLTVGKLYKLADGTPVWFGHLDKEGRLRVKIGASIYRVDSKTREVQGPDKVVTVVRSHEKFVLLVGTESGARARILFDKANPYESLPGQSVILKVRPVVEQYSRRPGISADLVIKEGEDHFNPIRKLALSATWRVSKKVASGIAPKIPYLSVESVHFNGTKLGNLQQLGYWTTVVGEIAEALPDVKIEIDYIIEPQTIRAMAESLYPFVAIRPELILDDTREKFLAHDKNMVGRMIVALKYDRRGHVQADFMEVQQAVVSRLKDSPFINALIQSGYGISLDAREDGNEYRTCIVAGMLLEQFVEDLHPKGGGRILSLLGDMWTHWLGLETPMQLTQYVSGFGHRIVSLSDFRRSGAQQAKYANWLIDALHALHSDPAARVFALSLADDLLIVLSRGPAAPGSHWHQLVYVDANNRVVIHEEFLRWLEAHTRSREQAVAYLEQALGHEGVERMTTSDGWRFSHEQALRWFPASETLENALIAGSQEILPEIPFSEEGTVESTPAQLTLWLNAFSQALGHRFTVESRERLSRFFSTKGRACPDLSEMKSLGGYGINWAALDYLLTHFPESESLAIQAFLIHSQGGGDGRAFWDDWRQEHRGLPPFPASLTADGQARFFNLVAALLALDGDLEALHRWVDPAAHRIIGTLWPDSPPPAEPIKLGYRYPENIWPLVEASWPAGAEPPLLKAEKHKGRLILRDLWMQRALGDAQRGDALLDMILVRRMMRQRSWQDIGQRWRRERLANMDTLAGAMRTRFKDTDHLPADMNAKGLSQLFEAAVSAIYAAPHATRAEALRQTEIWIVQSFQEYLRLYPDTDFQFSDMLRDWAADLAIESAPVSAPVEAERVEVPTGTPALMSLPFQKLPARSS